MKKFFFLLIFFALSSCKKENIEGIIIGKTLFENQSLSENKELESIIKLTLKGDYNSLKKLNQFPCSASGCYDKGYILTQIIYKMGETKFIEMTSKLDQKEIYEIDGYIKVGLEYGDNNYDGKMDNKTSQNEFPTLMQKINYITQ